MQVGPVLLVTPQWTRDGGIATHVMASATALAERGVTVNVAAARIESATPPPGVVLLHSPELFNATLPPEERLGDALSGRPATIHIHQLEDPQMIAFMRQSAPVVLGVHGYIACSSGTHYFRPGHECSRAHGPGCIPHLALRTCVHARHLRRLPDAYRQAGRAVEALRSVDMAVSYSSAMDRHLAANGAGRRRVIPLFPTIAAQPDPGRAERRRVLFAGRVVANKGIFVLLRAARDVDGEFVVCGDGFGMEEMRRLAERLGVAERVRFTGWLGSDGLARELAEASVVTMPSIWPEPFGLVGIEAFAAGRPVVASLTGGIGDWLDDGVNGLAVRPGDARGLARALNELLADPARQQTMGAAGKRSMEARFSADRHVDALLDAYQSARSAWERERVPA